MKKSALLILIIFILACGIGLAQTTAFTYQGRLTEAGTPATGQYDFAFLLCADSTALPCIGSPIFRNDVEVAAGVFTVNLDFGASPFTSNTARFLEIFVRPGAGTEAYTTLAPRQPLTSSPFSIKSLNADIAVNITGVVAVANGGTGSSTQNFVDLTTNQTVGGTKTFTNPINGDGSQLMNLNGANITGGSVTSAQLSSDALPNSNSYKLLGSLRWDLLKGQSNFAVGTNPIGIAFDGANMWVVNSDGNNVTKLRASDGANLGTFTVGSNPGGIAFDGANMWIVSRTSANVVKLRVSDGANLGTFPVGSNPFDIAFDGANMWVANVQPGGTVIKLGTSDGANLGTFNPVVVTFSVIDPNQPVDFTLRAASTFHAANIRVRCGTPPPGKPEK